MRLYQQEVINCYECPNCDYWGDCTALEKDKHIDDLKTIPNWCPLPKISDGWNSEPKTQKATEVVK